MLQLSDDADHYVDGERRYVRVSRVLGSLGLVHDYTGVPDRYRIRGTAVHLGCRYVNEKRLDWATVDLQIKPFIEAYIAFLEASKFIPLYWEIMLSSRLGFAGTIDLIGTLNGRVVLIDIKTGNSVDRAVELQTGGYEILWNENNKSLPIKGRFALQLKETGKFSLKGPLKGGPSLFRAIFKTYQWKLGSKFQTPARC